MTGVSLEQIEAADEMTLEERNRLVVLEDAIDRSVRTQLEAGEALREIRDRRLYRRTHGTFEEYARQRFTFERAHAYRLIDMARVVEILSPAGDTPTAERQARELAPLLDEPEKLTQAWQAATSTAAAAERPVTAADVREARRQVEAPPAQASAPAAAAAPPAGDPSSDLRFAHIEEAVQLLKTLPSPDRIVWPVDGGDMDATAEAVEWLAKFAPALARAWREHKRSHRRLHAVS